MLSESLLPFNSNYTPNNGNGTTNIEKEAKEFLASLKNEIKKSRKCYPLSFKKKVVRLAQMKTMNYSLIQRELGVSRKSIYTWVNQVERLINETDEKRKRLRGAGRKPNFGDRISSPFSDNMSMEESIYNNKDHFLKSLDNNNIGKIDDDLNLSNIENINGQNEKNEVIGNNYNYDYLNEINTSLNLNSMDLSGSTKIFESSSGLQQNEIKEDLYTKKIMDNNEWEDDDKIYDFLNDCHSKSLKKLQFTVEERKKIVELTFLNKKKFPMERISKLSGVPVKTLELWRANHYQVFLDKESLELSTQNPTDKAQQSIINREIEKLNLQNLDRLDGDGYPMTDKERIVAYIDKLREEKIAVTSNMIIAKMLQIRPEFKNRSMRTLQSMCYRILKRNHYSLRKASHLGGPLPVKSLELFYDFFRDIIRYRYRLEIFDKKEDYDRLVNIDETPIYFEMITDRTYNKKGAKVVSIETKGNEKKLITCVLACSASGKKLTPSLIFKGGKEGNLELKYKNLECVKNKKIVVYFQSNAWCDEGIFKKWIKDVYILYEEEQVKKKCILIMDKAPSHIYRSRYLEKKNKNYVFIPGGLTRYLQPLDIGINKQFKDHLKNLYLENLAENIKYDDTSSEKELALLKRYENIFGDGKKPTLLDVQRLNIINWVIDVWRKKEKIKPSAIINSFNKAAITFPMDGSRYDEFIFPEEVLNQKDKS